MKIVNQLIIERIQNLFDKLDNQDKIKLIQNLEFKDRNYSIEFRIVPQ